MQQHLDVDEVVAVPTPTDVHAVVALAALGTLLPIGLPDGPGAPGGGRAGDVHEALAGLTVAAARGCHRRRAPCAPRRGRLTTVVTALLDAGVPRSLPGRLAAVLAERAPDAELVVLATGRPGEGVSWAWAAAEARRRPTDERVDERLERAFDKRTATALGKLGLQTVGRPAGPLPAPVCRPGCALGHRGAGGGEHVTILARVEQATVRPMRNRTGALMEVVVTDGNSRLSLTFFGKHRGSLFNHEKRLVPGAKGLFTGTVGLYRGARQLTHPDFTLMGEESDLDSDEALLEHATKPIPIYPAAAGSRAGRSRARCATCSTR